jgi:hypothetical protein
VEDGVEGGAVLAAAIATACLLMLPSAGSAAISCWQRVITDWSSDGRVDHTYPLACYRQAAKRLPEDLKSYSSAPDDIGRALTERRSILQHTRRVAAAPEPVAVSPSGGVSPLFLVLPPVALLFVAACLVARLRCVRSRPRR